MNDLKSTLVSLQDKPYATAVSAVLEKLNTPIEPIPLSETVNSLLGMSGIPSKAPTNEAELIALCEALAKKVEAYARDDDDDSPDAYMTMTNQYRARYSALTDEDLLDLNDKSVFDRMHQNLERLAAVTVLIDIAVDRNLHVPPLWKTIETNMGGI